MATAFMPRIIALLAGLACATVAAATDVALIGVIGDSAAVLAVDGGEPKTVKVGQRWNGIAVLSVERDRAEVEIEGRKRTLSLGQHYRGVPAKSDRQQVTLAADARGHFVTEGTVNGNPVRFLVDTGATSVVLPGRDAERLGLDYRKGERGLNQTANGVVATYRVTLDSVRVGDVEVSTVDAVVIEQGLNIALLGMSFLNRVEMQREGRSMVLIRRF